MNIRRQNLAFEKFVKAALSSESSADKKIISVDHFPADFRLGAAKADVGNLMLAATRGAATKMDTDLVLVPTAGCFQLVDELDHPVLRLGHREVAELNACTRDATFAEIGRIVNQSQLVHLRLHG